ncbi:MAG: DUF333 domain-containing protein [Candidatus Promineifilaceae bacterium]|nr:DUF333 domain-containing protein [Candidatus Promineifilaceae bacterium]
MRRILWVILALFTVGSAACRLLPGGESTAESSTESSTGAANPASEYCVELGGSVEIRDESDGQVGYCMLPGGSECDEWELFRGECTFDGDYRPLAADSCNSIASAMGDTLGLDITQQVAEFDDYVNQTSGMGCQAGAQGDGNDFESAPAAADELGSMLAAQGWAVDAQYAADSPTGTARAYSMDGGLCLLNVGWQPAAGADCPDNQPIAACELAPEQQLYTAVINCAQSN